MYLWCFYLRVTSPLYGLQIPQFIVQVIARVARLSGVSVHLVDGEDSSRGDGHLFFHAQSAIFDTLVIDPCANLMSKLHNFF